MGHLVECTMDNYMYVPLALRIHSFYKLCELNNDIILSKNKYVLSSARVVWINIISCGRGMSKFDFLSFERL